MPDVVWLDAKSLSSHGAIPISMRTSAELVLPNAVCNRREIVCLCVLVCWACVDVWTRLGRARLIKYIIKSFKAKLLGV